MSLADVNDEQQEHEDNVVEDEAQTEADESQDQPDEEDADAPEAESEGIVVSIGDESPPSEQETEQPAPEWVKNLRKDHREEQRKRREAEKRIEELTKPAAVEVGPMPALSDEDVDYDSDKLIAKYDAWKARKDKADLAVRKQQEAQQEAVQAFEARRSAYGSAKAALKVQDFDDAEAAVVETLDPMQQTILITGADNSALLVYALGKNPSEAKKLASIKDPVQFAFAAARLENKLKVTPRKAAPLPEGTVRGTAPVRSSDQKLARLEAEADRTGDRTKIREYRQTLKARAA